MGHGSPHSVKNSFDFLIFLFINIENRIFKHGNIKNIFLLNASAYLIKMKLGRILESHTFPKHYPNLT